MNRPIRIGDRVVMPFTDNVKRGVTEGVVVAKRGGPTYHEWQVEATKGGNTATPTKVWYYHTLLRHSKQEA